jgi:hypothetical protein
LRTIHGAMIGETPRLQLRGDLPMPPISRGATVTSYDKSRSM